jgi:hypothetical protein
MYRLIQKELEHARELAAQHYNYSIVYFIDMAILETAAKIAAAEHSRTASFESSPRRRQAAVKESIAD